MLRELTRNDWLSVLNIPADRIPEVLVLRGTRNLKANYAKHKAYFSKVLELGSPNGIFEDIFIGVHDNVLAAYASVYGDAMASEITHLFGVLGTPLVIQTGCCGALVEGILPGDIICVTTAHCGEGAAQYYLPNAQEVRASLDMLARIPAGSIASVELYKGPIWTTSALLAEGRRETQLWSDQGYIAVDMETASTFAVAKHFGMKRLSLLFVFDNPRRGDHILMTDRAREERRAVGERAMIELVLSIIEAFPEIHEAVNC